MQLVKTTSFVLSITFFLIHQNLNAQSTSDLDLLGELIYKYAAEQIDSCFLIADSIRTIVNKDTDPYWKAKADFYLALCQSKSENFNEAHSLMEKFATYAKENDLQKDIAQSLFHLAHIYRGLERGDEELESINESIRIFDLLDDKKMQAKVRVSKSTYMRIKRDYISAKKLLEDAKQMYESLNDSIGIAETYNEQALIEAFQGNMEEALKLFELQNDIYKKTNNQTGLAVSLGNVGFANLRLNNIDIGEKYIKEAYEIRKKLKQPERTSMSLIQLAEVHVLKEEWPQALAYSEQALTMSKEYEIEFNESQCYRQISYIYEKMGNTAQGLKYYKDYEKLKDKLLNEKIAKNGQRIEAAYQTAEKETQIIKLEADDKLNEVRITQQKAIIAGSLAILGLMAFMFFRVQSKNRQINKQNDIITKALGEKEILLKEIHHRVKNNLQVISSLLGMQSRSIKDAKAKEAILEGKTRVHSMSLIHQNLYQKDNLTGIEMKEYLSKLSKNLYETYSLDRDTITLDTDIDNIKLDVETVIPIGLIVNELITNSLKYAFPNNVEGKINITLKEQDNQLVLTVTDNGIGLSEDVLVKKVDSFGHSLIRAFRKKLDAELNIRNQNGTTVELAINNYKKIA